MQTLLDSTPRTFGEYVATGGGRGLEIALRAAAESCGQCPACKFGTGEVTRVLHTIESGQGTDQDLEFILTRARASTDGQKCALPTGESLLIQSLVQLFPEEFGAHLNSSCTSSRDLPFHKIVGWDAGGSRFMYDPTYARKQPDWTSSA